jgi:endonuclease/exonuclease/phosphatase family metal-dependent hydrolase
MTDNLRVMTFNIRGFYNADGVNAWPEREALNVRTIRRWAPDLIGFQEANGRNIAVYHRELPEYHYVAWPPYNNEPPHQFPAIFWNAKRLRPLACDAFWLSATPDVYSASWGTDCIRGAAWVRFSVRGSPATFVHLNTHLDHVSELARTEGARLIIERLDDAQAEGDAAIVTGDFNAPVSSSTYTLFRDAGYVDAHPDAGHVDDETTFTYHGYQGAAFRGSHSPPRRIDWILLRNGASTRIRTVACEIVRDCDPPRYPSDHYPVIADVELA